MKAKKKPLDEISLESFGIDVNPRLEVLKTQEPPKRQAGIKVASATELVEKLSAAGVLS
jgi:electron transfer flavoprotein beta subunit